jgi:hypothetical protein
MYLRDMVLRFISKTYQNKLSISSGSCQIQIFTEPALGHTWTDTHTHTHTHTHMDTCSHS